MPNPPPLALDVIYHIYNRGNNRENIFREQRNYPYFLQTYIRYIEPVADTYAYCLLRNHFHLIIHTKTIEEQEFYCRTVGYVKPFTPLSPSHQFANLFNSYARVYNKTYGRTGSLFERPFHRRVIVNETYLRQAIRYVHHNPQHHEFVDDFRDWPYSSYQTLVANEATRLMRDSVFALFDGREGFISAHQEDIPAGLEAFEGDAPYNQA